MINFKKKCTAALTTTALALAGCSGGDEAGTTPAVVTTGADRPLEVKHQEAIDACHAGITQIVNESDNMPDSFEWSGTPEVSLSDYGLGNATVRGTGMISTRIGIPWEHNIKCTVKITPDGARLKIADAEWIKPEGA